MHTHTHTQRHTFCCCSCGFRAQISSKLPTDLLRVLVTPFRCSQVCACLCVCTGSCLQHQGKMPRRDHARCFYQEYGYPYCGVCFLFFKLIYPISLWGEAGWQYSIKVYICVYFYPSRMDEEKAMNRKLNKSLNTTLNSADKELPETFMRVTEISN